MQSAYQNYCGSCHMLPDPQHLPKRIWAETVLPQMWNLQGAPALDSLQKAQLTAYILAQAPDALPEITKQEVAELEQFKAEIHTVEQNKSHGIITSLSFDSLREAFWIGDALGRSYRHSENLDPRTQYGSPVVSTFRRDDSDYVTLIGYLGPSDLARGHLLRITAGAIDTLAGNLRRPVFTHIEDLNNNGQEEILISEFGNNFGALTLLERSNQPSGNIEEEYEKRELVSLPGCIKVAIADLDHDGRKDILALFGQAREGMKILYQQEELNFEIEEALQFTPEFGSSWFELADINADGFLDVILANGDNADYSIVLKPYHGVRIFLNDGENQFEESYFFPMHGATRVLVEDFDKDGDLDLAAMAFFPDFQADPQRGFVYLENLGGKNLAFAAQTTPLSAKGNWLVMDKGDMDGDGDTDIILGNFYQFRNRAFQQENPIDLLILKNLWN
ncbi:Dihaem cytochrome c [Robiginitalea myxolifaciens]|uniref:Dihaem cytochrome c n=1 Tax=Robiginitalea myxolifaciens TaxID=400055 RepID=A0A1I6FQM6_9FLAO|nr:VCBS repeat-containing protein [Robiginitalea myxolifaciens]SFR32255.1 Dihaem cytochrome c [Robiginitalea myxolifaciens]